MFKLKNYVGKKWTLQMLIRQYPVLALKLSPIYTILLNTVISNPKSVLSLDSLYQGCQFVLQSIRASEKIHPCCPTAECIFYKTSLIHFWSNWSKYSHLHFMELDCTRDKYWHFKGTIWVRLKSKCTLKSLVFYINVI